MVDHVLQCVDMLARCAKRDEGACDGQRLLGIVELCVGSYDNGGTFGCDGSCGTASGSNVKFLRNIASVGCGGESADCVTREASRVMRLYNAFKGDSSGFGVTTGNSRSGEFSNVGLVDRSVDDSFDVRGKVEGKVKKVDCDKVSEFVGLTSSVNGGSVSVDDVSVPVEVEGFVCRGNNNDDFVESSCVADVDCSKDAVSDSLKGKPFETKTERNRRWRAESKILKKKRQAMKYDWRLGSSSSPVAKKGSSELRDTSLISEEDVALKSSLKAKWKVQNELAVEKARRELEVLKASDISQEVKRYRTKISAATERNMVSIEKTHAMLRQTGNLPEERGGGFVETVVSGVPGLESGSGTISPDSSASMAEFRACQKALLDAEREIAEYKRKIKIASEKYGFPLEQVDFLDKEVWTDTQTNQDILDEIYPNGYGKDTSLFEDGKFRAIGV